MGSESAYTGIKNTAKISNLVLSSARDLFFLKAKVEGLLSKTIRNYNYVLDSFADWFSGAEAGRNAEIESIDHHLIRKYLLVLQEKNLSKATLATHHRILRVFFNFLKREGFIDHSPLEKITAPRLPKQYPYILEEHQVKALIKVPELNTFAGLRNYVILLTFFDTGIRLGELVRLNLQDVNLMNRSLRVTGKGEKTREVFMGRKLVKAMHRWIQKRGFTPYEEALFTSHRGERLTADYTEHLVNRLGRKAGITGVRCSPHTLRHTFSTNYIRNGGDPFSLQQLLGHSDIKTVMIYVHMAGVALREAHAKYSPVDRMAE